jgi:hypothetical protein
MQGFLSAYAVWSARRHRRPGHLFQGRYKAEMIEDESYYWTISRYIHLNPVRAGLVARPEQQGLRRGQILLCAVKSRGSPVGATPTRQTGSLQPVAIGAAVEATKPSEPSRQMYRSAVQRVGRP